MRTLCMLVISIALAVVGAGNPIPIAEARDTVRTGAESQRSARERRVAKPRQEGRATQQGRAASEHAARPQRGRASYYGRQFNGRRMANGRRFDPRSNSAANRTLPLGTRARVTNLENGRTRTVTIEDRGPHVPGRILDVSPRTAEELGMRDRGVAPVEVVPTDIPRTGAEAGAAAANGGRHASTRRRP